MHVPNISTFDITSSAKLLRTKRLKSYTYLRMITCLISSPNHGQRQSSVALLSYSDSVQLLSSERVTMTSFHRALMPGQAVSDTKMTSLSQYFHFCHVYSLTQGGVLRIYEYSSYTYISYFLISFFTQTLLHNMSVSLIRCMSIIGISSSYQKLRHKYKLHIHLFIY